MPNTPPSKKELLDVLIVTPLPEEYEQLNEVFSYKADLSRSDYVIVEHVSPTSGLRVASILQHSMGSNEAAAALRHVENHYDVGVVIGFGIAGSLSRDNKIGDVCYSGKIIDVQSNYSAESLASDKLDVSLSPTFFETDNRLLASAHFLRSHPKHRDELAAWSALCGEYWSSQQEDLRLPTEISELIALTPSARSGPIVCGPVVKAERYKEKLRAIDRQVLAVEMESGGLFVVKREAAASAKVLAVRGISDFADETKTTFESATQRACRAYAARNAASFIHFQLRSEAFLNFVKSASQPTLPFSSLPTLEMTPAGRLQKKIDAVGREIEEALGELSPEYRLKPSGYVLPTPRLRRVVMSPYEVTRETLQDLMEVLECNRVSWINLDNTYPDDSLPWIVGKSLLGKQVNGRIAFPIVISGDRISPPNGTIEKVFQQYGVSELIKEHDASPILIIADPNMATENRRKYLISQLHANPDVTVILVSRDHSDWYKIDSTAKMVNSSVFEVDRVPFKEIAYFLKQAFGMEYQKAEVLAGKLDSIFDSFNLPPHPTYFAGIPESVLSAFLQANRRAELIQLAVDGYLTFLVAGDEADITLSRTTRLAFLRMLAVEMYVKGHSLTKVEVINQAEAFARRMDYKIDPAQWIEHFFKRGILRTSDNRVDFALPFMRHYILSLELCTDADSARLYFDLKSDVFDLSTFTLYCEMTTSNPLIECITRNLKESESDIQAMYPPEHVMLSRGQSPLTQLRPERYHATIEHIEMARRDIEKGGSNAAEKQAMLDIAREANRAANQRSSEEANPERASSDDNNVASSAEKSANGYKKRRAVQNLIIACTALGAGAEQLQGDVKQALIRSVMSVASHVVNGWTRDVSKINASTIESDIKESEQYQKLVETFAGDEDKEEELNRFVANISQTIEYNVSQDPIMSVLHIVSEYARHRVLAQSIVLVESYGRGIEMILLSVWLADLSARQGAKTLKQVIKQLNPNAHLRVVIAEYLLLRVHWDQWKLEDRNVLVNLAYEVVKTTEYSFSKDKMKRELELSEEQQRRKKPKKRRARSRGRRNRT